MRLAIFCSGNGSNFQAIVDSLKAKDIPATVVLMLTDQPGAFALKRAKQEGIKSVAVERKNFKNKEDFEAEIIRQLEQENIGLICLAGYMRLVGPGLIRKYPGKILNIHPALLPAFKGTRAIKDAWDYGAKVTGVSVHFVDKEMDHGPIILQQAVEIKDNDTEQSLAERIHQVEHKLYPRAVKLFVAGKLKIAGRKVIIC
ncbi:MAG: phosphoribosylglycinamide formyltransferase [Candidatus Omnitrophica bacterium]|nr:phosphoribosylglycinamide formyltransferase [Candidatus Omnitrophota bacterium]